MKLLINIQLLYCSKNEQFFKFFTKKIKIIDPGSLERVKICS